VQLAGKVAIVTGAGGGGSGQAEALRLGREGVSVVVNEINEAGGRETVRLIQANGGRAAFFYADVGDEQAARAQVFDRLSSHLPKDKSKQDYSG
jgi:NAD(P)-dependent dehydrogenase (short-subunit alcohol dehydrogenase family)